MFALGIPRSLNYIRVKDLSEALEVIKDGNSKPLAGGQSLLPLLKFRITNIDTLVDINELDLHYIKREGNFIRIGSLTTHNEIASKVEFLRSTAITIADLQVRNRGTIGGSLANADPSANYYPSLLVLGAEVKLVSKRGSRVVPIVDFYVSPYTTLLREDEIIEEVIIPIKGKLYFKVFKKGGSAYPIALVSVLELENKLRVGVGGVFERPLVFEGESVKDIENAIIDSREKRLSDVHADSDTRLKIALQLLRNYKDFKQIPIKENVEISWKSGIGFRAEDVYKIELNVNGIKVEDLVEPRTLLLDFLRKNGFKEVRRGCDEGKCGACTVLINGHAVKSCLILAVQAVGHEVRTIKGVKDSERLKEAFVKNFASQCGYCTHGFLMTVYDYLKNIDPTANKESLKVSIRNICRCTGYVNILKAIREAKDNL